MSKSDYRNDKGYKDDTAGSAIQNIKDQERVNRLCSIIFSVCKLAGFRVEGRITLVDEKSGKVWK